MATGPVYYPPQQMVAPAVAYNTRTQAQTVMMVPAMRQPKYEYRPNNYLAFSLVTALICGIFSPLTLAFSVPACFFARKSEAALKMGDITLAKKRGMVAAYLTIAAITAALFIAALAIGLIVGIYSPIYWEEKCKERAEDYNYYYYCSF